MNTLVRAKWTRNTTTAIFSALILSGCLSEEKDDTVFNGKLTDEVELSGSVGDGPVVGASMQVTSNSGELLA